MGVFCPPKVNEDYVKRVDGILKILLLVVGVPCWGLVYIGDVMTTSNESPEINDQVLFCTALSLPSWLLTLFSFAIFLFAREGEVQEVILFKFDAGLNLLFSLLYITCVAYCGSYEWFVWWCEDSLQVVDTGKCFDSRVLRNSGQNLAVVILGSVLAVMYCAAGIVAVIKSKEITNEYHGPTADEDL